MEIFTFKHRTQSNFSNETETGDDVNEPVTDTQLDDIQR